MYIGDDAPLSRRFIVRNKSATQVLTSGIENWYSYFASGRAYTSINASLCGITMDGG